MSLVTTPSRAASSPTKLRCSGLHREAKQGRLRHALSDLCHRVSFAQTRQLGTLLRGPISHLLSQRSRKVGRLLPDGVCGLLLLIRNLMDNIHVWENLGARVSCSNSNVLLLLSDRGTLPSE
jgi:hypothetical protein